MGSALAAAEGLYDGQKDEEWRLITDWPYSVSDQGRVRNNRTNYVIRQQLNKGYLRVTLANNGTVKRFPVHHLVCSTFTGPRPSTKHVTRHLNGNGLDNKSSNIVWGTQKENIQDQIKHGTYRQGERSGTSKLTEEKVIRLRREHAALPHNRIIVSQFYTKIAKEFGVSISGLKNAVFYRTWRHI